MHKLLLILSALFFMACSSTSDRSPASRAGRPYKEPKVMNNQNLDTQSLYQACLREWPELYCRNRLGR